MDVSQPVAALRRMVRGDVRVSEPLSAHTTLRVGGPADAMVFPAVADDLVAAVRWCLRTGTPYAVLGAGSNVLVPDEGLRGMVLRLQPALDFMVFDGLAVRVGAGTKVARLVAQAAQRGLAGAEGLAGVPGLVGGALVMNAGTRRGDIGRIVRSVRVVDHEGAVRDLPWEHLSFAYRGSILQRRHWVALEAELRLEAGSVTEIRGSVDEALQYRNRTQPLHLPNAGSVFKNPPGDVAGRLVEAGGSKGMRVGDAQVSELHANWIVNLGGATAEQVISLMLAVHRRVRERTGVDLEPEIRLLGGLGERWRVATRGSEPAG